MPVGQVRPGRGLTMKQLLVATMKGRFKTRFQHVIRDVVKIKRIGRSKKSVIRFTTTETRFPSESEIHDQTVVRLEPDKLFTVSRLAVGCDCLRGATRIKTINGYQRIDQITVPTVYLVGGQPFVGGPAVYKGRRRTMRLTTGRGSVFLTPDHRVLITWNGRTYWYRAERVRRNWVSGGARIVSVGPGLKTKVYDVEVPNIHRFEVENGLLLHNCSDLKYRFEHALALRGAAALPQRYNGMPAIKTNPTHEVAVCKHLIIVFKALIDKGL